MGRTWELRSLHHKSLSMMCHALLQHSRDPLFDLAEWGELGRVKQDLAHVLRLPPSHEITTNALRNMLLDTMRDYLHGRVSVLEPHGSRLMLKFEYKRTRFVEAWFEHRHNTLRFSHWRKHLHNTPNLPEPAASSDARSRSPSSRGDRSSADIRGRFAESSSSDRLGRKRERSQSRPMRTTTDQCRASSPSTENIGSKAGTSESPQTVAAELPEQDQHPIKMSQQLSSPRTSARHRLLRIARRSAVSITTDSGADEGEVTEDENPKRRRLQLEDTPAQHAAAAMLQTPQPEQEARPLPTINSDSTVRESNSADLPAEQPQLTRPFCSEKVDHDDDDDDEEDRVPPELRKERHALVLRICDKLQELRAHRLDAPLVIDLTVD